MATIIFSFTTSAPGKKKGLVCLVCAFKGIPSSRKALPIEKLESYNPSTWDKKTQRFQSVTDTERANNAILDAIKDKCDELLDTGYITTPQQLIDAIKENKEAEDLTEKLGDFISVLIDEQRQLPTKNYQLYLSLLHNLDGEDHKSAKGKVRKFEKPMYNGVALVDTQIEKIADEHLMAFANWVKRVKKGANYKNLNATLLHVVNEAKKRKKNFNVIEYRFREYAPIGVKDTIEPLKALTAEQFEKVLTFSGQVINPKGHRNRQMQPLYLDFALLQYYTMARPADVLLWRSDMIHTQANGIKVLKYIPYKKRTHDKPQQVQLPLNSNALAIIEKYSGQSKGGYLFPFPMNETRWDITTKDGNDKWRIASNTIFGNINAHLKKIGTLIGVEGLTLYYFRRSVFSHVANTGINLALLAKHGGTSVKMLEQHYIKDTELQPIVF